MKTTNVTFTQHQTLNLIRACGNEKESLRELFDDAKIKPSEYAVGMVFWDEIIEKLQNSL